MPAHSLSIYIQAGWFDEAIVLPRSKIPFQLRVPEKPSLYLYQKSIVSLPNQKQEETQSPRGHMARRRREKGKPKHEGNLFGYAMPKEVTPVFDLYFCPPPSSTRLSQKNKASYEKTKPSTRDGPKKVVEETAPLRLRNSISVTRSTTSISSHGGATPGGTRHRKRKKNPCPQSNRGGKGTKTG